MRYVTYVAEPNEAQMNQLLEKHIVLEGRHTLRLRSTTDLVQYRSPIIIIDFADKQNVRSISPCP